MLRHIGIQPVGYQNLIGTVVGEILSESEKHDDESLNYPTLLVCCNAHSNSGIGGRLFSRTGLLTFSDAEKEKNVGERVFYLPEVEGDPVMVFQFSSTETSSPVLSYLTSERAL